MKGNRRGGLGRGLASLIPPTPVDVAPGTDDAPDVPAPESSDPEVPPQTPYPPAEPAEVELAPVPGARFAEIPVDSIVANVKQPRHIFDDEALEELKASISEVGLLQPIVVRHHGDDDRAYEIVMGERRWRAAKAVGRETIPAIIRETRDDAMLRDALLENIHRVDLNPLEEAAAYQQLLEEFGATHEELARRIGRSRSQISNTIRLLNLPPEVQSRVAVGVLSAGHARALLGLATHKEQEDLARRIVEEGLSVRATEELVILSQSEKTDERRRTAPRQRRVRQDTPGIVELADRWSNWFDTRVKVDLGLRKGKIMIEFATVEDLERIVNIIESGTKIEE